MRAPRSFFAREILLPVQAFVHTEEGSGLLLLGATAAAILWANSPWGTSYFHLWETVIGIQAGRFSLSQSLHHWVNDGLMTVFFFVVGLEVKRELIHGELSDPRRASLPALAALGGMVFPASLYLLLNAGGRGTAGWGIPMATDIAFALGVLALLGRRVPAELRIFLLALAVADDLGAILLIAVFYTANLSSQALGLALFLLGLLVIMNRCGVTNILAYVFVGGFFWVAVYKSGVHATIAGVILGALTPAHPRFSHGAFAETAGELLGRFRTALAGGDHDEAEGILGQLEEVNLGAEAPLERLLRVLHPWTGYVIVPLFALANAGVLFSADRFRAAASSPVTLGIFVGLLAGKLAGILGFSWVSVRAGLASLPAGVTWRQMVGIGMLAGIGFTVSLFISGLAFDDPGLIAEAKIGIFSASLCAGLAGYGFLRAATGQRTFGPPSASRSS